MATAWSSGGLRYPEMEILDYTNQQLAVDGALTWNLVVSADGIISQTFIDTFQRIKGSIRSRP
jgi:hypothetical protein